MFIIYKDMSCTKRNSNKNRKPILTSKMKELNQTYIWRNIKENPNIYCWLPSSKKNHVIETIDIKDVNIQNIPPIVDVTNNSEIMEKLQSNADKIINKMSKYSYKEKKNHVSYNDPVKYKIVKQFIKDKDRVLYGGKAINLYLPKDKKIYSRTELADFDFFSPTPWKDATELADKLYNSGFEYTKVSSAINKGTFKIFSDFNHIADITFMNSEIYDNFDTRIKQGMRVVNKDFLMSTFYNQLSQNLNNRNWNKLSNRLRLFKKYVKPISKKLSCSNDIFLSSKSNTPQNIEMLEICYEFINDYNLVFSGAVAYNTFIQHGGGKDRLTFNYYDVYSENAFESCEKLLLELNKKLNIFTNFNVKSNYDNFKGINRQSYILSYKGQKLCQIFNIDTCLPIKYLNNKWVVGIDYLKYEMYIKIAYNKGNTEKDFKCALKYLEKIQANYYKKKRKNEYDDTPFQRFISHCLGNTNNKMKVSLINRWITNLELKKNTRVIFPKTNSITINNVKGKRIEIKPLIQISSDCKNLNKKQCNHPCFWNNNKSKCFSENIEYFPYEKDNKNIDNPLFDNKNKLDNFLGKKIIISADKVNIPLGFILPDNITIFENTLPNQIEINEVK